MGAGSSRADAPEDAGHGIEASSGLDGDGSIWTWVSSVSKAYLKLIVSGMVASGLAGTAGALEAAA